MRKLSNVTNAFLNLHLIMESKFIRQRNIVPKTNTIPLMPSVLGGTTLLDLPQDSPQDSPIAPCGNVTGANSHRRKPLISFL
jgi:hypothetical protein